MIIPDALREGQDRQADLAVAAGPVHDAFGWHCFVIQLIVSLVIVMGIVIARVIEIVIEIVI